MRGAPLPPRESHLCLRWAAQICYKIITKVSDKEREGAWRLFHKHVIAKECVFRENKTSMFMKIVLRPRADPPTEVSALREATCLWNIPPLSPQLSGLEGVAATGCSPPTQGLLRDRTGKASSRSLSFYLMSGCDALRKRNRDKALLGLKFLRSSVHFSERFTSRVPGLEPPSPSPPRQKLIF